MPHNNEHSDMNYNETEGVVDQERLKIAMQDNVFYTIEAMESFEEFMRGIEGVASTVQNPGTLK